MNLNEPEPIVQPKVERYYVIEVGYVARVGTVSWSAFTGRQCRLPYL